MPIDITPNNNGGGRGQLRYAGTCAQQHDQILNGILRRLDTLERRIEGVEFDTNIMRDLAIQIANLNEALDAFKETMDI